MKEELLKAASDNLVIQDVYLHDMHVKPQDDFYPFAHKENMQIQFRHFVIKSIPFVEDIEDREPKNLIRFQYMASFRALPANLPDEIIKDEKAIEDKILVEVTATFVALYESKEKVSEESLKEFATYNVGYHVWPYWREFASSMTTRLRLPAFTMPLYRIPNN